MWTVIDKVWTSGRYIFLDRMTDHTFLPSWISVWLSVLRWRQTVNRQTTQSIHSAIYCWSVALSANLWDSQLSAKFSYLSYIVFDHYKPEVKWLLFCTRFTRFWRVIETELLGFGKVLGSPITKNNRSFGREIFKSEIALSKRSLVDNFAYDDDVLLNYQA